MSLLDSISTPADQKVIATIIGDAGMGKTSLAATFPKTIFIRPEDGLQSIPLKSRPDAFPVIEEVDDLWQQIKTLIQEDHSYQTAVIDSVTALERIFSENVLTMDPGAASINQALGGYGAGNAAVSSMHHRLRKGCGILRDKKQMNIVFIAHAELQEISLPDCETYSRYGMRLGKKSTAPYLDDVDLVGFIKLETYVKSEDSKSGDQKKKHKQAISDGTRQLVTYACAANVSKNRFGITDDLQMQIGVNPLAEHIPALATKTAKTTKKEKE